MDEQLILIRKKLQRIKSRGKTEMIPEPIKELVTDYALRMREKGETWKEISIGTGISDNTINRWCKSRDEDDYVEEVIPVKVLPDKLPDNDKLPEKQKDEEKIVVMEFESKELTLETPTGFKLKGLKLKEAVKLLKELSC